METQISIYETEDKFTRTNNKPYLSVQTSKGQMSAWDAVVIGKVKAAKGMKVNAVIEEKGNYKNIVGLGDPTGEAEEKPDAPKKFTEERNEKLASVAVSYAKDLAVAGKIEVEDIAEKAKGFVELIKTL